MSSKRRKWESLNTQSGLRAHFQSRTTQELEERLENLVGAAAALRLTKNQIIQAHETKIRIIQEILNERADT